MNIFTKVKNNFKYAYYRKLGDIAIIKAKKSINDIDDFEFRRWALIGLKCMEKCSEIPIK